VDQFDVSSVEGQVNSDKISSRAVLGPQITEPRTPGIRRK
jgi:hypothetical protein